MFWTRLGSGIVLLALSITAMGMGGLPLAVALCVISVIGFRELIRALNHVPAAHSGTSQSRSGRHVNVLELLGVAGIAAYYLLMYFSGNHTWLFMCIVFVFMAMMFAYVITFPKFQSRQVTETIFAFLYAPVMLSFIYQTRMCGQGSYMVWMILISSWGCDTFAYVVGKLIGKKKIFPVLSPKKSLEGCIGGALGAVLLGWLYGHFFVEKINPGDNIAWSIAFICGVGAVMSMVGDLAASAIKRDHEIKDYGKLIPGHGGIMDRFDSVIVTAPMTYFLTIMILDYSAMG